MAPDLPGQRVVAGVGDHGCDVMLRQIDAERFRAGPPLLVGRGLSTLRACSTAERSRTSPRSGANASDAGIGPGSSESLRFDSHATPGCVDRNVSPALVDIFPVTGSHYARPGLLWDRAGVSRNPFMASLEKDESPAFVRARL